MRRAILALTLLVPSWLWAEPAAEKVERLLAAAWGQPGVRVEWTSKDKPPAALVEHSDWRLAEPRPRRLAGRLVLVLERRDARGSLERTAWIGTARVFGPALTVKQRVDAGLPLDTANVAVVEAEWTHLSGELLCSIEPSRIAARALVPGRALLTADVRPAPVIRRGQQVWLVRTEGNLRVRVNGRALEDGAPGETVAVAADLGKSRSFTGTVAADGTVLLSR